MPYPLEEAYRPLLGTLPATAGDTTVLTPDLVGTPQGPLQSNRLVIQAGTHQYNEAPPVKIAYLYGSTAAVESLGLLLFAALLDPQGERRNLTLTHPHSDVKEIRLACPATPPQNEQLPPPTSFRYTPHAPRKHPWLDGQYLARDLPHLTLSHSQHAAASQSGADTLLCAGSAIGTALLAASSS